MPSTASIRRRCASTTSTADAPRSRTSRASSVAVAPISVVVAIGRPYRRSAAASGRLTPLRHGGTLGCVSARARRVAGWGLALLALANACAVVGLWLMTGGPDDVHDLSSALTAAGRIAGLLGAYLVLVELLLLARIPLLERIAGFERLAAIHRVNGRVALGLLLGHAALITAGYTIGDRISLLDELDRLITGYPGVITAIAGLTLLVAVVVTSAVAVRRRLRYETWYFVHLYAYLAVALAFSHQLATGTDFVARPGARAYWYALYGVTLGALVVFRLGLPLGAQPARAPAARGARHRGVARRRLGRDRRRAAGPAARAGRASSSPGAS